MVDVIVTTCGTLDHDIARVLADYYHGDFAMDDKQLRVEGVNRLGNVLVPDDSYGIPIENWMQPILADIYNKESKWLPWEIWHEVGLKLLDDEKWFRIFSWSLCQEKHKIVLFQDQQMGRSVHNYGYSGNHIKISH